MSSGGAITQDALVLLFDVALVVAALVVFVLLVPLDTDPAWLQRLRWWLR